MQGKKTGSGWIIQRTDKNHSEIMTCLRRLGCSVSSLHSAGEGIFDLLVSVGCLNILIEVKDGSKPPSKRQLTEPQKKWHFSWQGLRAIATCPDDCVKIVNQTRVILSLLTKAAKENNIPLQIEGASDDQYKPNLF